jgi:hypothetical protein
LSQAEQKVWFKAVHTSAARKNLQPRLFEESADVFGNIGRSAAPEGEIHFGVRAHQIEYQHVLVVAESPADDHERRGIGNFIGLVRLDDVTHGATLLRQAPSGFGVAAKRRGSHYRQARNTAEHKRFH